MELEKYGVIFEIVGSRNSWSTWVWIDHQGFSICEGRTKREAQFYKRMFSIAINRLINGTINKVVYENKHASKEEGNRAQVEETPSEGSQRTAHTEI